MIKNIFIVSGWFLTAILSYYIGEKHSHNEKEKKIDDDIQDWAFLEGFHRY